MRPAGPAGRPTRYNASNPLNQCARPAGRAASYNKKVGDMYTTHGNLLQLRKGGQA